LQPLSRAGAEIDCSNAKAMGDLITNVEVNFADGKTLDPTKWRSQNFWGSQDWTLGGKSHGSHHTAGHACSTGAAVAAQNACNLRPNRGTYEGVLEEMDSCLQSMWDEGITAGQKGHWETMRSTDYTTVSCGFAWLHDIYRPGQYHLWMNQDFYRTSPSPPCTCTQVGT